MRRGAHRDDAIATTGSFGHCLIERSLIQA
jgi:hypothetical protein